jgi:prepilin-type processing-associated H-X9-DG protein
MFLYKAAWLNNASDKVIVYDGAQRVLNTVNNDIGTCQDVGVFTTTDKAGDRMWYNTGFMEDNTYWTNKNFNIGQNAYVPLRNADDNSQDIDGQRGWTCYRHGQNNTQCNMLFGDGHVQTSTMNPNTFQTDLTLLNFHVHFPVFN